MSPSDSIDGQFMSSMYVASCRERGTSNIVDRMDFLLFHFRPIVNVVRLSLFPFVFCLSFYLRLLGVKTCFVVDLSTRINTIALSPSLSRKKEAS